MIEECIRKELEKVGVDTVRCRLASGKFYGAEKYRDKENPRDVSQVIQWVREQDDRKATQQRHMMNWTRAGTISAIIAAITGIITAFPVIRGH